MIEDNIVTIPSGCVLTKEQTDMLYEIAKLPIPVEAFKSLGLHIDEKPALELEDIWYWWKNSTGNSDDVGIAMKKLYTRLIGEQ